MDSNGSHRGLFAHKDGRPHTGRGPNEGCSNTGAFDPHGPFCVGDAIDPATGLPVQHFIDYQTAGPFPMNFERYYANNDKPRFSMLGNNMLDTVTRAWRSNFDARMLNPYLY